MKALILAAGRGKRLSGITDECSKCMIPLSGKPILEYTFERLSDIDIIDQYIVVVGYKAETIIDYFGGFYKDKEIVYVYQKSLSGIVDAISCASESIGNSDFFLNLGDEYMLKPRLIKMIDEFYSCGCDSLIGTINVTDKDLIKKTYSVLMDSQGYVYHLREKPESPYNFLMGTGSILFRNDLLKYLNSTPVNPIRGEKELVDFIMRAVEDNKKVRCFDVADGFVNLNTPEDFQNAIYYADSIQSKTQV